MKLEPWQEMVVSTLVELSDVSFQERVWVRHEGGEISSPSESVNQLFDDPGLGDLLEAGHVFSNQADRNLRRLSICVDSVDFDKPIESLLVDERWLNVRQLAWQALQEVKAALYEE